jgi:hypothetical protein
MDPMARIPPFKKSRFGFLPATSATGIQRIKCGAANGVDSKTLPVARLLRKLFAQQCGHADGAGEESAL